MACLPEESRIIYGPMANQQEQMMPLIEWPRPWHYFLLSRARGTPAKDRFIGPFLIVTFQAGFVKKKIGRVTFWGDIRVGRIVKIKLESDAGIGLKGTISRTFARCH